MLGWEYSVSTCMLPWMSEDRVHVASVDYSKGHVVIRLYDLDGLNLKERVEFNVLNLTLGESWCYLVSLSPDMLAFARDKKFVFYQSITVMICILHSVHPHLQCVYVSAPDLL